MIRPTDLLIAVALTAAMSGAALAQTPVTHTITGDTDDSWVASGFVGTNFGTSTDNLDLDGGASLDFGGQLAYIWNGVLGGEIIADFAPNVGDNLLFANEPEVNSYMANVITAVPLSAGNFQPYVSGGFGAIQIRSDLFDLFGNTFSSNHTRFGGNIGGGVMAFAEHVGIRADIRYYRATSDNNLDDLVFEDDVIPRTFLSGLGFWRGNVGLAIRW
jgi:hypothetical protein